MEREGCGRKKIEGKCAGKDNGSMRGIRKEIEGR